MKWALTGMVLLVYVLHQDLWFWSDRTLVFGVLPIGLAYHAGYCILAALMMAVLVRFAWPGHLDQSEASGHLDQSSASASPVEAARESDG